MQRRTEEDIDYNTDEEPTANDLADDVDLDNEPEICPDCSGSGEGYCEEQRCWRCKGRGVV